MGRTTRTMHDSIAVMTNQLRHVGVVYVDREDTGGGVVALVHTHRDGVHVIVVNDDISGAALFTVEAWQNGGAPLVIVDTDHAGYVDTAGELDADALALAVATIVGDLAHVVSGAAGIGPIHPRLSLVAAHYAAGQALDASGELATLYDHGASMTLAYDRGQYRGALPVILPRFAALAGVVYTVTSIHGGAAFSSPGRLVAQLAALGGGWRTGWLDDIRTADGRELDASTLAMILAGGAR